MIFNLLRWNHYYGWKIVLAGSSTNFIIVGVVTFGFGAFINPLREELGWSTAAIAGAFSLRTFEMGFLSPVAGYLVDRFGARKTATVGVLCLTAGLIVFSQVHDLWLFYLSSVLMAMGQSFGALAPFAATIMRWFSKFRGRAMGFLNAGNGMGPFSVPVFLFLISTVGWRSTLLITAVFVFTFGLPLISVLRKDPRDYGLLPDGAKPKSDSRTQSADKEVPRPSPPGPDEGLTVREALRVPALYLFSMANAVGGATQVSWIVHQVPHLENVGFSKASIGIIAITYAVMQLFLRIGSGWVADYVGRRGIYAFAFLLQGVGMLAAANVTSSSAWTLLPLFFLTYPAGHAIWVVISQAIVADYFGVRRFATIRGLSSLFLVPIGVSGPIIAGRVFDLTGTYHVVFSIYALVAASGALWVMLARRPETSLRSS